MKISSESSTGHLRGIASLFDDFERKELFKKYLFFLIWVEVLIFAGCWIYQLGDGSYDRNGPIDIAFPWKTYFLVAFLAPVAITFLLGVVIVGFNKYFGGMDLPEQGQGPEASTDSPAMSSGRLAKLNRVVGWVQRLPFLALLLLLSVTVGFLYKIDAIVTYVGDIGEKTVKIILFSGLGLVAIASLFLLILIVLNYQLRKKSMEYQYRSEVAERFGLIILDDRTVLNKEGVLLLEGTKNRGKVPMLPAKTTETGSDSAPPVLPRPADVEGT